MAVVNPMISPLVYPANVKDSRWLTLDVCREFTRNKCTRSDDECRFAHPPPNVEVQNGRVMCCFDSIKGKCQRREPPCKYLHPPQHLKEQLLQNGRNNLILKHLQMQMVAQSIPGVYPIMYDVNSGKSFSATSYIPVQTQEPYLAATRYLVPNGNGYGSYYTATPYAAPAATSVTSNGAVYPANIAPSAGCPPLTAAATIPYSMATTVDSSGCGQQLVLVSSPASNGHQNGMQLDRPLENGNSCQNGNNNNNQPPSPVWPCNNGAPPSPSMVPVDTTGPGGNYNAPIYFQTTNGMPAMMPVMKPSAAETKCGVPFYQPATFAYQQMALAAMQLQQPAYVPITIAGHPPIEPRY